jgi:hypothetical protein
MDTRRIDSGERRAVTRGDGLAQPSEVLEDTGGRKYLRCLDRERQDREEEREREKRKAS